MALLIEHYKGEFPFWLAPVQFGIVPIREKHNDYAKKLAKKLKGQDFRVEVNCENDNMRNKIRQFQLEKIPYIIVVGDRETENNTFAVRSRKDGDLGVTLADQGTCLTHVKAKKTNDVVNEISLS